MTETWDEVSINDIKSPSRYSLAMGPFGSNIKTDNFVPMGVPIIRGGNLSGDHFKDSNFVFLTEEKADELKSANAFPGDLIFTHRGTLGQVGIIPKNAKYPRYVVSQSQMKLSCDLSKIDPLFVYYFFRSDKGQHELLSNTSTTGVPAISSPLSTLRSIRIPYPPLPIQHTITHILGSLDNKIEIQRHMNETLEAIARTIFQSWFVDFDPVQAKVDGRQPGCVDASTAEMFPSEFEEIEGREVPKGWRIASLSEIFEINPQRSLAKDQIAPYLDMQNVPTRGHRPIDWVDRDFSSGTKFVNGDTLMARITPCLENGKTIFVDFLNDAQVGWGSTEYIVLRPKSPLPPEFGYLLARDEEFRAHAILNMSGSSGRQRVPSKCFDSYQIVVPTKPVAEKFGEIVKLLMVRIKKNDEQSRTLVTLRDSLLPKLMSGEIPV